MTMPEYEKRREIQVTLFLSGLAMNSLRWSVGYLAWISLWGLGGWAMFGLESNVVGAVPLPRAATLVEDDYQQGVFPLLKKNCVACHNAKTAEGGLNLESHTALMAGGDSGPSVIPGDGQGSELLSRVRATDDSVMPPDDNGVGAERLTPEEIELLSTWIDAGAPAPKGKAENAIRWRELAEEVSPVYTLEYSDDGQYLGFSKGNVAYVVPQPLTAETWAPVPLLAPDLSLADGSPVLGTDKDLIHSLTFSHDGQRLAVGGYRTVQLWERHVQAEAVVEVGLAAGRSVPTQGIGAGQLVLDPQQVLRIVDRKSGQVVDTVGPAVTEIRAATWAEDGRILYTADESRGLTRWQRAALSDSSQWAAEALDVQSYADLAAGSPVVGLVPTAEAGVRVVLQSGRVLKITSAESGWNAAVEFELQRVVRRVAASPDGQWLVALGADASASVWRLSTGEMVHNLGEDYGRWQRRRQWQQQATRMEGWVQRWSDLIPGLEEAVKKEEEARTKVAETHQKAVEAEQAKAQEIAAQQQAKSHTEQAIAALEQQLAEKRELLVNQQKKIDDLQKELGTAQQNVAKANQALVSADAGLQLARDKIPAQQAQVEAIKHKLAIDQAAVDQYLQSAAAPIVDAAIATEQGQILLLDQIGRGLLYHLGSGLPLAVLEPPSNLAGEPAAAEVARIADEASLMLGAGRVTVRESALGWEWDLSLPWRRVRVWGDQQSTAFSSRITALAFSPDDRYLAVGSGPPSRFGDLKMLSVETGELTHDFGEVHSDTILALSYSPDGRWLASAGADKLCRIHDPNTGEMLKILEGHTHFVQGLSWHSRGQLLATASADRGVKTWDVETGERRQALGGFGKEVSGIDYVAETDQLIAVSLDGHARLYRGDNGQMVRDFGRLAPLHAVAASPDGLHVTVGDCEGRVRVYKTDDGTMVRQWPN